jgi:hypothetical protein
VFERHVLLSTLAMAASTIDVDVKFVPDHDPWCRRCGRATRPCSVRADDRC